VKIILVSHGPFSKGLMDSVQMILGEQTELASYCLMPEETPVALAERLKDEIKTAVEEEKEILFFTDLFHGTPFNVVVSLMENYYFGHITGVSLPLLMEALMSRNEDTTVKEMSEHLMEEANGYTLDVNKLLEEK